MKKIVILFVLALAGLFLALDVLGSLALRPILQNAVGAPVSLGRLHVDLLASTAGLYDLKIKNPKGFQEKTLAEIHEISADYDPAAFLRGKIHLKTVRLLFGDITIEKNGRQINLLELGAVKGITQGMGSGTGGGAKPPKPGEGGGKARAPKGPGLQIDEVLVSIGKTRYVDSSVEPHSVKEYDLGIHEEKFKDVTQAPSLVKDIALFILRKIGLSSLTSNFDVLLKGVGGELESTFQKLLKA